MKVSIQTKLLGTYLLLVFIAIVGLSGAYYLITRQDKRRESRQRVQIAFDIMLNDFADRRNAYLTRFREFLKANSTIGEIGSMYEQGEKILSEPNLLNAYISKVATVMKDFGRLIEADKFVLYATDKRLLVAYQRHGDQDAVGGYVLSGTGKDTYLPLDNLTSTAMYSIWMGKTAVPDTPLPAGIVAHYERDLPDTASTEIFSEGPKIGIKITTPVTYLEKTTGVLVCEIVFTQNLIQRYASLSKTDINLFAGKQLSLGTLSAQTELNEEALKQSAACEDLWNKVTTAEIASVTFNGQEYYQGRCALRSDQKTIGAITVSLLQKIEKQAIREMLITILMISGVVIGVAFGLSLLFSRNMIRAIHNIVNVIVAAAAGDLRKTALVTTRDEIGMLASNLNQMIAQLRNISGQVQHTSQTINGIAETILRQMETLIQHIQQQSTSVDQTTSSVETIKHFVDMVAHNSNDLLAAAAEILSSMQETRASIDEVTASTGSLTVSLHLISSSVEQVNNAVKQISGNIGQLEEIARQTETEIHHIEQSFRDVSQNADHTQQLAKETMDAALSGQTSVEVSIQGMTDLKAVAANTARIIQEVNSWGEQVSSILGIVDEITEQTSLLALNASIISAQAGVHGRGFAVVADEIKNLAIRTKSSTKEIGQLIRALQEKTREGVNNTAEGISKAEQGMHLANTVKDALNKILDSATRTSQRAADTAQVIQQTTTSSQTIRISMTSVTDMVSHIRTAIHQEEQDIEQVVAAVENISGMAEQVNHASIEQKKAAEMVATSMEDVTGKFSAISEQTETLQQHSDQIVTAMHTIESTTEQILENTTEISGETVKNLVQQSDILQKVINVFKVS